MKNTIPYFNFAFLIKDFWIWKAQYNSEFCVYYQLLSTLKVAFVFRLNLKNVRPIVFLIVHIVFYITTRKPARYFIVHANWNLTWKIRKTNDIIFFVEYCIQYYEIPNTVFSFSQISIKLSDEGFMVC